MPAVYQNRNTLKSYFQEGDFPSQEQFAALIDAFYHRSEDQAPISFISGLTEALAAKASAESLAAMGIVLQAMSAEIEFLRTGNQITDYTYGQLLGRKMNGQLIPGRWYGITDFQSLWHYFDGGTGEIVGVGTGAYEKLYVFATGTSTLAENAISNSYRKHVIKYSLVGDEDTEDIGYFDNDGNPVIGYKGKIYFRHDIENDISAHYDWKQIKFRTWAVSAPEYSASTSYLMNQAVKATNGNIYICMKPITGGSGPMSDGVNWRLLFDLSDLSRGRFISFTKDSLKLSDCGYVTNLSIDTNDYRDALTFTTSAKVSNIHIGKTNREYVSLLFNYSSSLPNIVVNVYEHVNGFRNVFIDGNSYNIRFIGTTYNIYDVKFGERVRNVIVTSSAYGSKLKNVENCIFQTVQNCNLQGCTYTFFPGIFYESTVRIGISECFLPLNVGNCDFDEFVEAVNLRNNTYLPGNYRKKVIRANNGQPVIKYINYDNPGYSIALVALE
ncbi:MAG: hypothetical protein PHE56_04100 [Bacteroidales bacterium]|nr:hypothetical protein [Bacteroidales bacterium]